MCGSRAAVPALCFEQVVGRCHFDPEMDGSPPSFLAISRSKWHLRGKYRRRESGRPAILSCGKAELRLRALSRAACLGRAVVCRRWRIRACKGIAADSSPGPREQGLPADGANRARTARRRKCLVTSRGARNIFSPLVDDLTVCDPLCSFCGDRTDNLTPACKRDETPIRRCTHGKSGNDVRL